MARKNEKYKIEYRSRYGRGILSTVTAAASVIIFLTTALVCMVLGGKGGQWVGAFGFTGFVMAFYGMAVGLDSFRERSQSYTLSKVGTLLGGAMVAVWFIVFCAGMAQ